MQEDRHVLTARASRAKFLTLSGATALGATVMDVTIAAAATPHGHVQTISPDEAFARLQAGNKRYVSDTSINCNKNYDRRAEVAGGQMPFAIVLGCSDSRVPPETIFDQRIGDLFTIRLAGNIADDFALGSMEYAIGHFASPLLLVLGHSKCGAVSATLDVVRGKGEATGHIAALVNAIKPAVVSVLDKPGDTLANAIDANVLDVARGLPKSSAVIASAIHAKTLRVVGAHYDLSTGLVSTVS